ncbi:MAG TPA: hypothetical protein VHJ20_12635 [Polyangia bacterium]|nr:hypothetical protein [Polyangia bacterium]
MRMLNRTSTLLGALALLAIPSAGCMVSAEVNVPEVEVTQHDLVFDGAPQAAALGDVSMSKSFSQKHQRLELPTGLDTEVKALGVTLTAKSGIENFDFLKGMRVTMSDDVHDPVELIDYTRVDGAPSTNVLTMESANPVNTLDEWKTDSATFTVEVDGALPPQDWKVDLSVRFSGKVTYKY